MIANCKTCHWNFSMDPVNLCANVYYGEEIRLIMKEKRECNDYKISFEEFSKSRNAIKEKYYGGNPIL